MDRLDAMAVFLAAVDGGSLSAASRALGMPLPTVSRKVAELEAHLRTQLVVRTSRQLGVTEAGQAYAAACRRILQELDEADRQAAGEYRTPRGDLIVTSPIVFGRLHVLPVTLAFLAAYREVRVRLVQTDALLDLAGDHVDVALRIGALPDSSLTAMRLGTVRWQVCASPAYLAAHGAPRSLGDLPAHACIRFEGPGAPRPWRFRVDGAARDCDVAGPLTVNTAEAAIDSALASAGLIRVLSYQVAAHIGAGRLQAVLTAVEPEALPVSLLYAGGPLLALKLRAFLDFAGPRIRAALKGLG